MTDIIEQIDSYMEQFKDSKIKIDCNGFTVADYALLGDIVIAASKNSDSITTAKMYLELMDKISKAHTNLMRS